MGKYRVKDVKEIEEIMKPNVVESIAQITKEKRQIKDRKFCILLRDSFAFFRLWNSNDARSRE